jgi:uncharacterized ferritin-like protein (DUF455 family)
LIIPSDLYQQIQHTLLEQDPQRKVEATVVLFQSWDDGILSRDSDLAILDIEIPGRPELPRLVDPRKLSRRTISTERGRISMLHAIAHIEFNAINIALDAVYRFRQMPDQFVSDWLLVASEEARHFSLLNQYLLDSGSFYGELDAHDGLWEMVCKTRGDVLHRMAMVPRVMEARGLDVTPGLITRFSNISDHRAVEILRLIYAEEIGHVRIGNHWFQHLCRQRQLDTIDTFQKLVDHYLNGKLRGPFNWPARLEAGFEADELNALQQTSTQRFS